MFRALLRLVLVLVVLVVVGFVMGYRITAPGPAGPSADRTIGTTGTNEMDARAREVGTTVRDRVAAGATEAQRALGNAALTSKIKAKMALDDTIKDVDVNVDTVDGVVTLRGTVHTEAERTRVIQLARETAGVTAVNDQLTVR